MVPQSYSKLFLPNMLKDLFSFLRICNFITADFLHFFDFSFKVSGTMMHKVKCTDCTTLKKCHIIHQTGLKVKVKWFFLICLVKQMEVQNLFSKKESPKRYFFILKAYLFHIESIYFYWPTEWLGNL
jgi:hypothetical protein